MTIIATSLIDQLKPPVSRWATLGNSIRYFGEFATEYYIPLFFLTIYPNYRTKFALLYALINVCCSSMSALGGAAIVNRFGEGRPRMKSWVCVIAPLLATPFFLGAVLTKTNFWVSIACMAAAKLLGEPYRSPSTTMI